MGRDSASGNGIDIAIINQKEFKMLSDDEVNARKEKIVK
jgi:20S proteasome alpha/beta subunit